ncbi:MAG: hypothetical protein LBD50_03205, partial [Rickettsiales bacterium]|nr:hypothetical protein [Rickettsiales bacterium]
MKRFIAVLSSFLIIPAFAEVAPIYYEDTVEYADDLIIDGDASDETVPDEAVEDKKPATPVAPAATSPRATAGRSASRATPATSAATASSPRGTATRAVASRTAVPIQRATVGASTASRASSQKSKQTVAPRRNSAAASVNAARATTTGSLVQSDTVNTPLYTGRVGVRTNSSTSGTRFASIRSATAGATTATSATVPTGPTMDELAQASDFCKAQFTQCMDNFCNVLDDNQGRCSCSSNLKNYSKTEEALKKTTADLQVVAQKIQYIGLTAADVESLYVQTEAEAAMQGRTDNTQLKTDLDKIKNLIVDVKGGNSVSSDTSGILDLSSLLDVSFSSSGFDLGSFLGTGTTNTISNQRGAELFKTASARCKASVLDSCKSQGVDTAVITNSYDLEIDKQCIAYERSLTEANDQMTSTVMNAQNFLQKARLLVTQQKNSYDLRGCVNALDSCMQDDFVCGGDYENCLDPTGKYIVNGAIVVGSTPGEVGTNTGLYTTWNYDSNNSNAWIGAGNLGEFVDKGTATNITTATVPANMAQFLQVKIGYVDSDGSAKGMCVSVLNKCQNYTYNQSGSGNGTFIVKNNVVTEFLNRTLVNIKAKQDELISNYAENCKSDVLSCLS